jgi:hypothetical protein
MGKSKPLLSEILMGPAGVWNGETCTVKRQPKGKARALKKRSGRNSVKKAAEGGEWGFVNV